MASEAGLEHEEPEKRNIMLIQFSIVMSFFITVCIIFIKALQSVHLNSDLDWALYIGMDCLDIKVT